MRTLNIAVTVDPYIPVPPLIYGGIERIVEFVVNGLAARGHTVTLFAHPDSRCAGKLVGYGVSPHFSKVARLQELWQIGSGTDERSSASGCGAELGTAGCAGSGAAPAAAGEGAKILSRHCAVAQRANSVSDRGVVHRLCRSLGASLSTEVGERQLREWVTMHDGVEMRKFDPVFSVPSDAPLAFLGRLETYKGAHNAIEIARRCGRKLIIAGDRVEQGSNAAYFDREIAPHLDGDHIRYIGPVDDAQKSAMLGRGVPRS